MPFLLATLALYATMSLITFTAYALDKRRAIRGQRRIKEKTLHLLELAGGWPGALAAQTLFHHKRSKLTYMLVFAGIILLHIGAWLACWRMGWLS